MRRSAAYLVLALCWLVARPGPVLAVTDIHGTWLLRKYDGSTELVDVGQTGGAVSFTYHGLALTGTLDAAGRLQASGGMPGFSELDFDGDVSADGQLANAGVFYGTISPTMFAQWTLIGFHCGCVDGNATNGDGCDAECQVEPCWSCTAPPSSTCTALADGSPCQRAACTTGGTCTAGTCGGGTPEPSCFDLDGSWAVHKVTQDPFGFGGMPSVVDLTRTVRQRGSHLLIADSPGNEYFGTIDSLSGALAWTKIGGFYGFGICGPGANAVREPFTGTETAGNASFATTGTEPVGIGSRCPVIASATETGTRVGCADGTPCSTGDACITGETCLGGACQGGTAVTCQPCEACDPASGCRATPVPVCASPSQPATLKIRKRTEDAQDTLDWRWRSTDATPPASLGDPLTSDGFTLCVFDTTAAPALLFRALVPGGGQCGVRPCWKSPRRGGFSYADRSAAQDGTKHLDALTSAATGTRVHFGGKGAALSGRPFGLPAPPLPESLLVQLQADGGACFGASYGAPRVNDPATGTYRALSQ